MKNAKDLTPDAYNRYLFVGRHGTRKTTTAASWPKPYVWDLDNRIQALRGQDVLYDSFNLANIGHAEHVAKDIMKKNEMNSLPFKTLIFSSATSAFELFLMQGLELTEMRSTGSGKDKKDAGKWIGDFHMPDQETYGFQYQRWHDILWKFLFTLKCDIIVEAHVERVYDPKHALIGKRMMGTDKMGERTPSWFNEVWEFYTEGESGMVNPRTGDLIEDGLKYKIRFRGEIAKTTHWQLPDTALIQNHSNFYNDFIHMVSKKEEKEGS